MIGVLPGGDFSSKLPPKCWSNPTRGVYRGIQRSHEVEGRSPAFNTKKLIFSVCPDLRSLNCLKLIEIFFPVSFVIRRYGLQKKSSKNIEKFWSNKFFGNFPKNIFWKKLKILKIFHIEKS